MDDRSGRHPSPPLLPQLTFAGPYGAVVDNVNVSVFEYEPVRSASVAPMCWLNAIATGSLETGPVHAAFESVTCSGSGRLNAPLVRWPGSLTESAASPAVLMTLAVVEAVYVWSTPGRERSEARRRPQRQRERAGTVAPTATVSAVAESSTAAP